MLNSVEVVKDELFRSASKYLRILPQDNLRELCIITDKRIPGGYFYNNASSLKKILDSVSDNNLLQSSIYIYHNEINEDFKPSSTLLEKVGRMRVRIKDIDISMYNSINIDIVPKRRGKNQNKRQATYAERQAAKSLSEEVINFLSHYGIDVAAVVDSGNGYYICLKVCFDNTTDNVNLVKGFLRNYTIVFQIARL